MDEKTPAGLRNHGSDVWSKTYSFGPGIAKAFIIRFGDEVLVMSPSAKTDPKVFDEVEKFGKVSAILAPNSFHLMGIPEWTERFPDATIYGNRSARKRIEKKLNVVLNPIEQLMERTGPKVQIHDTSTVMKAADVFVTVEEEGGSLLLVNDLFTNLKELPNFLPVKLAYKFFKCAPGFEPNRFLAKVGGADKPGLMKVLHEAVEKHPPEKMVFSHGETLIAPEVSAAIDRL